MPEQRKRLAKLGIPITELPVTAPAPARTTKASGRSPSRAQEAFQRGLVALTQWVEQEGAHRPVPRAHGEEIAVESEAEPIVVQLGVWLSNTKSRRDKLTAEQLAALAALGMSWAGLPPPAGEPDAPARPAASGQPLRSEREHEEECDEELYEGGKCICWSIRRFGPYSERESYGDNL
ncbi:Helicase associated domain protein [Streptomyces sp. NPDC058011]|uniref:Helicase associated domain protein n=1 Tax=Streptomyces sp. NPDC058011 TaxID=3346305 RepID=UPI0036E9F70E